MSQVAAGAEDPVNDEKTRIVSSRNLCLALVDKLCDRFEEQWRRGEIPEIMEYVEPLSGEDKDEALRKLAPLDFVLRAEFGQPRQWGEYVRQYPELADVPAPDAPVMIAEFQVLKLLSAGSEGELYLAYDSGLDRKVVIKWYIDPNRVPSEGALLARGQARGESRPFLLHVLAEGFEQRRPYLVMEYAEGALTLEHFVGSRKLSAPARLALFLQVAEAVAALHKDGVVHQDLKPANILVMPAGDIRLIDFGLAQDFGLGHALEQTFVGGTRAYMAPEVAARLLRGSRAPESAEPANNLQESPGFLLSHEFSPGGVLADVFSLGGVLYFVLTGTPPYPDKAGETIEQHNDRIISGLFDRELLQDCAAPAGIKQLCVAAMERDVRQRLSNAQALADGVRGVLDRRRRRPYAVAAAAGLLLVSLVVTAFALHGAGNNERPGPAEGKLELQVFRGISDEPADLDMLVPPLVESPDPKSADWIRLDLHVPPGAASALYVVNGAGNLERGGAWSARDTEHQEFFPRQGQKSPLTGPEGTEFVFLIGRRGPLISEERVRTLWSESQAGGAWPLLSASQMIWVDPQGSRITGAVREKGFGEPQDHRSATLDIKDRLESFRILLLKECDFISGVAFGHVQKP
jgi:serine/threonine protein kinase